MESSRVGISLHLLRETRSSAHSVSRTRTPDDFPEGTLLTSWQNGLTCPKLGYARGPTRNAPTIQSRIFGLGATFVSLGEVKNSVIGWSASW